MGTFVATLIGNLAIIVFTLLFAIPSFLLGWVPPRGNVTFACAQAWAKTLLFFCGVRVRVEFDPGFDLPQQGSHCVYMANHQSLFDIPVLLATLPGQTRFMAKQSLFRIPLFGWAIAAGGFIPVDRKDRSRAKEAFDTAVARLQAGTSVLLFPEETRSLDGKLLPFQRGGFLLALKSGLPIVPVGIEGTLAIQGKKSFLIHPGVVHVRYGAPVPMTDFDIRHRRELDALVRTQVATLANAPA
ncbi:MAG TPA: lysophospholipid acyltransferase family protein [Acetobacteraceae bacterium]|jgi:1-acyl-sn-glycerol-3-phosphate acyltransferase|nr:lysophospholipid acyltransferase family protein [Acetobacteraceae bacterium]